MKTFAIGLALILLAAVAFGVNWMAYEQAVANSMVMVLLPPAAAAMTPTPEQPPASPWSRTF
jgi:hypothetical protein